MATSMHDAPEHQFSDGFLSEIVRTLRSEVHQQNPKLVGLMYSVNRLAVELLHELGISPEKTDQMVGSVLYARTLQSTQAAVLLLEHGMPTQARTILRSALETLFPLSAIAKDPRKADDLIASHDADRRTLADRIKRWKDPELRASVPLTDTQLDDIVKNPAKATNIFEHAKFAGMEDWYGTLYTILSFAAHSKISDLDNHTVPNAEGEVVELQSEPVLAGQTEVWLWIIEVQLAAMRSVAQIFSSSSWTELIQARWQLLRALAQEGRHLAPDSGG